MSRTERRDYLGRVLRDGWWGKKCSSPNCNVCWTGLNKRPRRRLIRQQGKRECQAQET